MSARVVPYLLVGIGSFIGGNARYILARSAVGDIDTRFPLATFLVNVSGSFLLGLIGGLLAQRATPQAEALRLALGVGFCGGFTTFSAFEFETHALVEDGLWLMAAANVVLSALLGFVAVRLGLMAARCWL